MPWLLGVLDPDRGESTGVKPMKGKIMYPSLWFWAPQFFFPWSGSVTQRIDPDTNWFFDGIRPEAGNRQIEKKAFDIASYGKQLGLITELVIGMADKGAIAPEQLAETLRRLKDIRDEIERLKAEEATRFADAIGEQLEQLRLKNPDEFQRVVARLR